MVPTFDDSRRMSVVDQWSVPFTRWVSLYVCSFPTRIVAGTLNSVSRADFALLDRGADRDELVRRTRLEEVGERPVRRLTRARRMGGLAGAGTLHRRHRQHVTRLHVDDHRHAALGRGRGDLVDERLLDLVLQRLVDAEHHVGTAARRDALAFGVGDVAPALVALDDDLAGRALQLVVVVRFETVEPEALAADAPDDRGRNAPGRVLPLGLRYERDTRQPEIAHLLLGRVVDRARDVDEAVRLVRQALVERLLIDTDDRRELRGRERRVGHERGVGVDRRALDRDREIAPVPVEDAAALGIERDGAESLAERHRLVVIATQHLQLGDPQRERGEHDHDEDRAHAEPPEGLGDAARSTAHERAVEDAHAARVDEKVALAAVARRPVDAQWAAAADDG